MEHVGFKIRSFLLDFSQNEKKRNLDLATLDLATLQNSDVQDKNGCRIRNQRPKIS